MRILYSDEAKDDLQWFKKNDKKVIKRIILLIEDLQTNPFSGIGKPERLKHELSGLWSRRIDKKNRLYYRIIDDETIEIARCKGHYGDK